MSGRCEECGTSTIWNQDIGSAICLECGTLADPTQSVLTSHLEQADVSGREFAPWANVAGGTTLRGRNGWALAGQGKEARDRRNTIAMHEFIRTLAIRLSNPGLASRAQGAFDQAMRLGQYRWGRKAKLTAGAALAIALRESHKSDSIRDIAYLLDESPAVVARAFSKVVELLQLKLAPSDPAVHLPMLQAHLVSLLDGTGDSTSGGDTAVLPNQLMRILIPLVPHLPSITRTATALSGLLIRTHVLAHVPTPPTACALLLLAVEAELSSSLPNAGAFSQALGARLGAGKGVVMQRYKQIYDLVEEWIREVPWLDAHERKGIKGIEGRGRSKVAKRVVVARGLKDVVQFQEEIWRKRVESHGRPFVQLDTDIIQGGDESGDEWDRSETGSGVSQTSSVVADEPHPRKKAKTWHAKPVVEASHFLLNPLSTALPWSSSSPPGTAGSPDLLTHLLTADGSSLPHAFIHTPTRLQLLLSARGGGGEHQIADDELFTEDELEGLIRSPEEAQVVRVAMGWDNDGEDAVDATSTSKRQADAGPGGKKRKRYPPDPLVHGIHYEGGACGSKKINMDALARLLDPDADLDAEYLPEESASVDEVADEGEDEATFHNASDNGSVAHHGGVDCEVVEDWRPPSPGGGGSMEDWYDFA